MAEPKERVYRGRKEMIINNFIGGIAWGLGTTVGLGIVIGILSFGIRYADIVPIVGDFIVSVNEYIKEKSPTLE